MCIGDSRSYPRFDQVHPRKGLLTHVCATEHRDLLLRKMLDATELLGWQFFVKFYNSTTGAFVRMT